MNSGARGRGKGVWKYSYGAKPHVVFAMERRDCGGQVFVRWTNPDKAGGERRDRKSLGLAVRDARTGRLDPKLVRAAEWRFNSSKRDCWSANRPRAPRANQNLTPRNYPGRR